MRIRIFSTLVTLTILIAPFIAAAQAASFKLDGENFVLETETATKTKIVNQYYAHAPRKPGWVRMIEVRWHAEDLNARSEVLKHIASVRRSYGDVQINIWQDDGMRKTGFDYVVATRGEFVEVNVYIYFKDPSGEGYLVHRYAERHYGDDGSNYVSLRGPNRKRILALVVPYSFPEVRGKK